jgi:hypothetical protein
MCSRHLVDIPKYLLPFSFHYVLVGLRRMQSSVMVSIFATFPSSVHVYVLIDHSTHPSIYRDRSNNNHLHCSHAFAVNPQLGISARAHRAGLAGTSRLRKTAVYRRVPKSRAIITELPRLMPFQTTTLPRKTFLRLWDSPSLSLNPFFNLPSQPLYTRSSRLAPFRLVSLLLHDISITMASPRTFAPPTRCMRAGAAEQC